MDHPTPVSDDPGGTPELILQAIIPPTDAPAEIRAAVADALARRDAGGERASTWEDITFAASAVALADGTIDRGSGQTQWVFALDAQTPRPGERLEGAGRWSCVVALPSSAGAGRQPLWRVTVYDAVRTAPRRPPADCGAAGSPEA